jgi:hypothetical protein
MDGCGRTIKEFPRVYRVGTLRVNNKRRKSASDLVNARSAQIELTYLPSIKRAPAAQMPILEHNLGFTPTPRRKCVLNQEQSCENNLLRRSEGDIQRAVEMTRLLHSF